MRAFLWLLFLVLHHHHQATPLDTEADLPPFLRGLGWRNVEKELRKDMSLVPSIRPISYDIRLNVSVRGYDGATRTTFDAQIELHSLGLNIKKVSLVTPSTVFELTEISYNRERETVNIKLQETLTPLTDAMLQIDYNGTAVMRGVGLYESWTGPDYSSFSSFKTTISLATFCEPTGARRWMPCFDEPDKKASFRLQVTHPTELTAYSNTEGATKVLEGGVSETSFLPTVPLPTYAVALALTKQRAIRREHKGKKIGVIGDWNRSFLQELANSTDVVRSKTVFENVTFFPEKTDWLIVDDHFGGAMENPGLITSHFRANFASIQIHELVHMYFGNLVTLQSWEQIWINEGLTKFVENGGQEGAGRWLVSRATLFEAAMHHKFSYSRSQYTTDHLFLNSEAAQLLNLIRRFIGEKNFDRAINRYLIDNSYKNGNSEMMIRYLSEENSDARSILEDWVFQPGVALLTVEEENERVIIQQRRFIRTDFIKELRDDKTRWTIPVNCILNGVEHWVVMRPGTEKVILEIPLNSTFSIDESYPYLYAVDYINRPAFDELSRLIGWSNNSEDNNLQLNYELKFDPNDVMRAKRDNKLIKEHLMSSCENIARNESREELWNDYIRWNSLHYLMCDETLETRETALRMLRELLVTNDLPVRNQHRADMAKKINALHPGILLELLAEESTEIDYLSKGLWNAIIMAAEAEEGGMEKLRDVIRSNPSFAANAYHKITGTFEEIFFQNEKQKRLKPK